MGDSVAKKFCEDTEKKTDKNESANRESELCSEFQDLTYDVLRIIFKFLNGKDLSSAAMVCRCWRDAATNEFKTRGPVYLRKSLDKNSATCDNYMGNKIADNLRIKPMLGIIFAGDVENSIFESIKDCYCSQLPSSCETVMLRTCDAISDDTELDKNDAVCVLFPRISKVKVNTFSLDDTQDTTNPKNMRAKVLDWIINSSEFASHEKSKCIMVFSDCDGYKHAIKMLKAIKYKYPKQKLSLIGGIVKDIVYCKHTNDQSYCKKSSTVTVVTLSGADIQTWSVIIPKKCYEEEEIEEKLKSLKEKIQLKKFSMGFMFSCVARAAGKKMETRLFKKIFPEVPLAGGFGDGEFGENTIQGSTFRKGKASRSYEYSTIFMILTYG